MSTSSQVTTACFDSVKQHVLNSFEIDSGKYTHRNDHVAFFIDEGSVPETFYSQLSK